MANPVFSDALTMANMQLRVIEVGEANKYLVCLDSPESERNSKWVAVIVMNGEYTIGQQRELLNRMSETSAPENHAVLEIKKQMQERLDQCRNDCRELVVFKNYRIRRLAELLRKEQANSKQIAEKSALAGSRVIEQRNELLDLLEANLEKIRSRSLEEAHKIEQVLDYYKNRRDRE